MQADDSSSRRVKVLAFDERTAALAEATTATATDMQGPMMLDGKPYCPRDQRLLIFKQDLDSLLCPGCGYLSNPNPNKKTATAGGPSTISQHSLKDNPDSISMKLVPIGNNNNNRKRLRRRGEEYDYDPDVKRLQDKGYVITDHHVTANQVGTYNVQEMVEQKRKLMSNRSSSSSFWVH
jgi:hypothetical protein